MFQVEGEQRLEMWVKEETSATRTSILEKWTRLQGMPQHQAMLKYMSIIKEWPGYGSTLFDVEVRNSKDDGCRGGNYKFSPERVLVTTWTLVLAFPSHTPAFLSA